jgi:O-antigen/teichoic acid export membrane protein
VKRRSIAANSALALGGDAASKVSGILAVALAARWLTVEQFALVGAALAAATILTAVLDGGLSTLIVRDGAASATARTATLRAGLAARLPLLALAFVAAAAFGAVRDQLAPALLVVAAAAAGALSLALLALFRAGQNLAVEAVQKLLAGLLLPALIAVALVARPAASTVLAAFVLAQLLALPPALVAARRLRTPAHRRAVVETLRATAPFALMAIATLAYYRAGTLLLAGLRPAADTANFTIASNVALGLLVLPNAITTGLLPSLSAARSPHERVHTARRTLAWTIGLCLGLLLAAGLVAPPLITLVFGGRYDGAATPLYVLLAADLLIAISGVLGTMLIANRRVRPVAVQVLVCLALNLACGVVLVRAFGATGAAVGTLLTEAVAITLLLVAVRGELADLLGLRRLEQVDDDTRLGAVRA